MRMSKMAAAVGIVAVVTAGLAMAQVPLTSGYDLAKPPTTIDVPWGTGSWSIMSGLIFDPTAGPMIKLFDTPRQVTGAPVLLDAQQPFPQRIDEQWDLVPGASKPVSDWHEQVLTPGWEWMLVTSASLITRNGQPWPWKPIATPVVDPAVISVEFEPILPGEVLDIHKALLWVGTPGNRIWGDGMDDSGALVDEGIIRVLEYPTPEPASALLLGLGGTIALARSRRRAI